MLTNFLIKNIARLVLISYITSLAAPVIHACEVETPSFSQRINSGWRDQSPPRESILQRSLHQTQPTTPHWKAIFSPSGQINAQVETVLEDYADLAETFYRDYQYRLSVKSQDDRFQLKLSRKIKESESSFQKLHTAIIHQGKVSQIHKKLKDSQEDPLITLFKGASAHQWIDNTHTPSFAWNIPGFGTVKITKDGSVFLDQDNTTSILSSYDLILKTTGSLFIQTLTVESLTLDAPQSHFLGAVVARHLHMDHTVTNRGGFQVHHIKGQGQLTNHQLLKLDGTKEEPAILGVRQVLNKKSKNFSSEPKIEGSYLHITSDNQIFHNATGAELSIMESLIVDAVSEQLTPYLVSFRNKGRIHLREAHINRQATNAGFWHARKMTVASFINQSLGTLTILDQLFGTSSFVNEGDLEAENLVDLTIGINKGSINAKTMSVSQNMTNEGQLTVHELTGQGKLQNKRTLQFTGESDQPAQVSIHKLENGAQKETSGHQKKAQITGDTIITTSENSDFITHENSDIVAKSLLFQKYSGLDLFPLILKGQIKIDALTINRTEVENEGILQTSFLSLHGKRFQNGKKALLEIKKTLNANVSTFQNEGEILSTKSFTQKSGKFINTGRWEHTGDIDLGSTAMLNEKGTLIWQKGKLSFTQRTFINKGAWSFDQMSCIQLLDIHNHGDLCFKAGILTFWDLINYKNIDWIKGQYYIAKSLQNHHVMKFLENPWKISDETSGKVTMNLGDIECEKALTYDVEVLPKSIKAGGDVIFSKRYAAKRTLEDLSKITTLGRVTFYCPTITTAKNYEFANIGHLDLVVDGAFTTHYSFKAPSLSFAIEGPLSCGKSNDVMGTIAATYDMDLLVTYELPQDKIPQKGKMYLEKHGKKLKYVVMSPHGKTIEDILDMTVEGNLTPESLRFFKSLILAETAKRGHTLTSNGALTITAHSIDARFGQIYGAGPTRLTATKGDIICGSAVQKGADFANRLGCAHEYNDIPGNVWVYTSVNDVNGAYIASNGTLDLQGNASLVLDYGRIFSGDNATLSALKNISAIRSIIQGNGTAHWTAPSILLGRAAMQAMYMYLTPWYPNVQSYAAKSDRTEMHFSDSIWFDTQDFTNKAATVSSGKSLFILHNGQYIDLSDASKHPPTVKMENYAHKSSFFFTPIIRAADKIQINMGNCVITGSMSSPIITIQATTGLFHNTCRDRQTLNPTGLYIIDITQALQDKARTPGFLKLTDKGEITSAFPMGELCMTGRSHKTPQLVMPGMESFYQPTLSFADVLNPLKGLSSNLFNLFLQETISKHTGKTYIQGGRGNRLEAALWNHSSQFYDESEKALVTSDDLKDVTRAMLLPGLQQVGSHLQQQLYLCLPPSEISPYQSPGDIVADVFDCETEGDQTHLNNRIIATDLLKVQSSKGSVHLATESYTVTSEQRDTTITQDIAMPQQQFLCTDGDVIVSGHKDLSRVGTHMEGVNVTGIAETGKNTQKPLILKQSVTTHTEEDDGWFSTETTSHTSTSHTGLSSTTIARKKLAEKSAQGIYLTGAEETAGEELIYYGPLLSTSASILEHSTSTTKTSSGLFSESSSSSSSSTPSFQPTVLKAPKISIHTDSATFTGTDFVALILEDNTQDGVKFGPTVGKGQYHQQTVSESPLASHDVGCEGWYEVMQPCRLSVNQIVRTMDEGQITLESVDWDKNRTEIIGKFAETTYELKKWHTEWAIHDQLIPDEALVVVALAISVATYGTGVKALAPMLKGITAATGLQLSAAGVAMVNAGFTTVCSSAATSFLKTGDPLQVAKDLTSASSLKSLGISMLSAELCQHIGTALKIDMNPSLKEVLNPGVKPVFTDFLQSQALKSSVNVGLNLVTHQEHPSQTLMTAIKDVALNSVAAWAAYNVGDLGYQGKMTPDEKDLTHAGIGALFGIASHPDKPLEGAMTGGLNAFAASRASRILFGTPEEIKQQAAQELRQQERPITDENLQMAMSDLLHQKTALSTILAASTTALMTKDPALVSTGIAVANTVTENNCIPSMTKSLMALEYGTTSQELPQEFWQDEFEDPIDLYYQSALEAAFPYEDPSRIDALVKSIKDFRKAHPEFMNFVDQGLYGLGKGLQYSAYTTGALTGFVMGGPVGASLGMALAKSTEEPLSQVVQYGIHKLSTWHARGGKTYTSQVARQLAFQEFAQEALPFLVLMGFKGVKVTPNGIMVTQTSSLKPGLLPTPFSKLSRKYIVDMETRSGIQIGDSQKYMLEVALRSQKFEKLPREMKILHTKQYYKIKDNIITQWEKRTGQAWPRVSQIDTITGEIQIAKAQIHHIIPQQQGGPHVWWNAHPLTGGSAHQGGVHRTSSPLNQILKDTNK